MVRVTFEHTDGNIQSVDFGPFHWIELNNDVIRIADTGEHIAILEDDHNWYIVAPGRDYKHFHNIPYNHVVIRSI